jgi:cytochrome c-type biogenesis protein CcmH
MIIDLPLAVALAAMIVAALAFAVPALWWRRGATGVSRSASNLAVHRSRLVELQREHAAGALCDEDFAVALDELRRSALTESADTVTPPTASARWIAVAIVVLLPVAALVLYDRVGDPSAARTAIAADESAAGVDDVRERLVAHLASQPRDGRAWVLLARADAERARYAEAARSYEKALAASPKIARDAGVWAELADALGMANGGRLEGRPHEIIQRALELDPAHPQALEMAGSAAYERRDFVAAARYWRQLAMLLGEGTPARAELDRAIERADRLATTALPPRADLAASP